MCKVNRCAKEGGFEFSGASYVSVIPKLAGFIHASHS